MYRQKSYLLIFFLILSNTNGQWQKIDYPKVPSTIAIKTTGSNFIVSTDGQEVYKALNRNFNSTITDSGLNSNP
jgi:hypothetical protein